MNTLYAPQTSFVIELQSYLNETDYDPAYLYMKSTNPELAASEADRIELMDALADTDVFEELHEMVNDRYSGVRDSLDEYSDALKFRGLKNNQAELSEWIDNLRENDWPEYPSLDAIAVPAGIPAEYAYYIHGAIAYYEGDWVRARCCWEQLLNLPEEQRQNRSTWAAFMLGKILRYTEPMTAVEWFHKTRELAEDGFQDSLSLAATSVTLEAGLERRRGNYCRAIELYVESFASGDIGAMVPLKASIYELLEADPEILQEAVNDPFIREIVNLFIASHSNEQENSWSRAVSYEIAVRWIDTLDEAGITEIDCADHIAWAAYRAGEMELAEEWLSRSPETDLCLWLQAKFAIRAGDLEGAVDILEQARDSFNDNEIWVSSYRYPYCTDRDYTEILEYYEGSNYTPVCPDFRILGDLGVVQLSLGRYEDAMNSFISGGYFRDGAYIGERVLSADEFKSYVNRVWPAPEEETQLPEYEYQFTAWSFEDRDNMSTAVRYSLARRLARLGRWSEARDYFPSEFHSSCDDYVGGLNIGNDESHPDSERAEGFWEAAISARTMGSDLFFFSSMPVETLYYTYSYYGRGGIYDETTALRAEPTETTLLPACEDELERLVLYADEQLLSSNYYYGPYRYIACDLAWQACELMPNETYDLAYRLCTAGGWIKAKDPEGADVFYKALVNRCGSTELGEEADNRRWFPDCDSNEYNPDNEVGVIYYWD